MGIHVNVDNFVRAETSRMFADIQHEAGGVNTFRHNREPVGVDQQTVIRLNRDTCYSFAIADLSAGGRLTLPDPGPRYISVMVVNEDHLVSDIVHGAGTVRLDARGAGSRHVLLAMRTLVDPTDPADLAAVRDLQDQVLLECAAAEPFRSPEWDTASLDETRDGLLLLARGLTGFDRMFGNAAQIDPVRHLIGTAAGWGGLPTTEAAYVGIDPRLPRGNYRMTFTDVPVDAFWSVSVYNAEGFFEPTPSGRYTVNSVTGMRDPDGSVTVRFVADDTLDTPNAIPTPEGWNLLVRLYRPRAEVLDGTWAPPEIQPD